MSRATNSDKYFVLFLFHFVFILLYYGSSFFLLTFAIEQSAGSMQAALTEPFPCARLSGAAHPEDAAAAIAAAVTAAARLKRDFRPPLRRLFLQPYLETVSMSHETLYHFLSLPLSPPESLRPFQSFMRATSVMIFFRSSAFWLLSCEHRFFPSSAVAVVRMSETLS